MDDKIDVSGPVSNQKQRQEQQGSPSSKNDRNTPEWSGSSDGKLASSETLGDPSADSAKTSSPKIDRILFQLAGWEMDETPLKSDVKSARPLSAPSSVDEKATHQNPAAEKPLFRARRPAAFIEGDDSQEPPASSALTDRAKSSQRMRYEAEAEMIRRKLGDLDGIRKQLGLSRRKISQLLLVDPSAWTRWTKGGEGGPPHIYRMLQWYLALEEKYPVLDVGFWLNTVARVSESERGIEQARQAHETAERAALKSGETAVKQDRVSSQVRALGLDLTALNDEISQLREGAKAMEDRSREQLAQLENEFRKTIRIRGARARRQLFWVVTAAILGGVLAGWISARLF